MLTILSGFLTGFLFGFVLERGYFCQFSGLNDAVMFKNFKILKATLWAILIAMIAFHLMATAGIITLNPKPFFWAGTIIGGIIFGIGMTMIGACAGGAAFKMGTGLIGYLIAGLGIAWGGLSAMDGFLKPVRLFLQNTTKVTIAGSNPTLASLFGLNSWILVIILAAVFILLLIKLKNREQENQESQQKLPLFARLFKTRWSPALTGISIGIIGMIAFVSSSAAGRNYPLGIVEGYIPILKSFLTGNFSGINWMYMLIIGIILGSAAAAIIAGEFRIRLPNLKRATIMLIGGFLLGAGAILAAGCNITHIISGLPQLSLGSIVAGTAIFGTNYLIDYFRFVRKQSAAK